MRENDKICIKTHTLTGFTIYTKLCMLENRIFLKKKKSFYLDIKALKTY